MDSGTSIPDAPDQGVDQNSPRAETAFSAVWQPADATLLQPTNLSISKVQRGWDRKPLSPFSKQRLRVGKVWKRAASSLRPTTSDAPTEADGASKRRKARTSFAAPVKPVKKMCLDSHFGMVPRVLQWESVESPARKIVTRSAASGQQMLALPDEEENEDPAEGETDVTVEILDEDGTVLEVGGEELGKNPDWQDDVDTGYLEREQPSERIESHLKFNSIHGNTAFEEFESYESSARGADEQSTKVVPTERSAVVKSANEQSHPSPRLPSDGSGLPEGFVSPMLKASTSRKTFARSLLSSRRRRTLPVSFTPAYVKGSDERDTPLSFFDDGAESPTVIEYSPLIEEDAIRLLAENDPMAEQDGATAEDWEDIEDEAEPTTSDLDTQPSGNGQECHETVMNVDHTQASTSMTDGDSATSVEADRGGDDPAFAMLPLTTDTETRLLSSPVPSIEGPHPRLPLRRSPRRKSSSPLKQSTTFSSTDTSHLIALTPIRGSSKYPYPSMHPESSMLSVEKEQDTPEPHSPIERAASAPPEEPTMSPQKPARPRVSDDTALLQAFLNRAAESRSSRRLSASKQESITNRRDSGTVRQALASPPKTDVLGDLDPNTPSPRKPVATDNADAFNGIDLGCVSTPERQDDVQEGLVTRRSDRASRRAQPQTPAAPNKIAIRGNAEYTVLKKTEAQELAILTRNNTRKNKGGSVLPPLRLTKLAGQTSTVDQGTNEELVKEDSVGRMAKTRGVRWAEILAEFYQGGESSESSILSDELNAPAPSEEPTDPDVETASAPAPSETPSKPKIRRLKPSRTASTPAKIHTDAVPIAAAEMESSAAQPQNRAAPTTTRRSRIATPAKTLVNASLLPSDLDSTVPLPTPAAQGEKKAATKKNPTASKLPAPLTTSTSVSQGKENLISSPPKKRAGGPPTAKTFAPKLDLGNRTQLQPDDGTLVPGLASPAKKGRWKNAVTGNVPVLDVGGDKKEEMAGLSSPAKKRTRRAGGV